MALTDVINVKFDRITVFNIHSEDVSRITVRILRDFCYHAALRVPHLTTGHTDLVIYKLRNLKE